MNFLRRLLSRAPTEPRQLLGVGRGAGLAGALYLAVRHRVRRPDAARLPEEMSPAFFRTRVCGTEFGQMVYHESRPAGAASGPVAPTLVFLHSIGVGLSSYEWSKVYPQFAPRHRVLAPDLIGFGESERPLRPPGADGQARALSRFLRRTCADGGPVVLVASGQGAGLAVLAAAHHPDQVDRLILLAPQGRPETTRGLRVASRLPRLAGLLHRNWLSRRAVVRSWLERLAFARPGRVTAEMVEVIAASAGQARAEAAVRHWLRGKLNVALDARLAELPQPVTILWPERAPGEIGERGRQLATLGRRIHVRLIEEAGPLAALEVPEQVGALLEDELRPELRVLPRAG